MTNTYLLLTAMGMALMVFALLDLWSRRIDEVARFSKATWMLTILFVPVAGAAFWYAAGRGTLRTRTPSSAEALIDMWVRRDAAVPVHMPRHEERF